MEGIFTVNRVLIVLLLFINIGCAQNIDNVVKTTQTMEETKEYIGMWVTEDGYIRHNLLSGNRYDEARGSCKSAYQGSYKVSGNHIDYKDDSGFTADGEFRNGVLYHAGMILYKEENE